MATMTVSLPEPLKDWIEALVGEGDYASTSDYVRDLVRKDKELRDASFEMTDALREKLDRSLASGISTKTLDEIFADAVRKVEARQKKLG
ncbi:type II toxin-antitoxin system ParD family antitoxin [Devosia sp.]|uniref:type II toxin-antitoxin system ParD family antitoxin n=1 Tax=Devosia sp. TaxID=1871048 RepID=UPI003265A588